MTRLGTRTVTAARLPAQRSRAAGGPVPAGGAPAAGGRTSPLAVAALLAAGYAVVALAVVVGTFLLAVTLGA
ncbi:MAG: hypothetical protein ACTHN8_12120 [Angustibacter sp.]